MIKYFCDICKREDDVVEYVLPIMATKEIKNKQGDVVRMITITQPKKKDLCFDCAEDIRQLIDRYQDFAEKGEREIDVVESIWEGNT